MSDLPWLWVDIETTGLGLDDHLLEIAGIITNDQLVERSRFEGMCYFERDAHDIDPYVLAMHDASGLWDECAKVDPYRGTRAVLNDFEFWFVGEGLEEGFSLAGSGVAHFDAPWLDHHSPLVAGRRTYYSLDVGPMRRFLAPWGVEWSGADGEIAHRALDDVEAHLDCARELIRDVVSFRDAAKAS